MPRDPATTRGLLGADVGSGVRRCVGARFFGGCDYGVFVREVAAECSVRAAVEVGDWVVGEGGLRAGGVETRAVDRGRAKRPGEPPGHALRDAVRAKRLRPRAVRLFGDRRIAALRACIDGEAKAAAVAKVARLTRLNTSSSRRCACVLARVGLGEPQAAVAAPRVVGWIAVLGTAINAVLGTSEDALTSGRNAVGRPRIVRGRATGGAHYQPNEGDCAANEVDATSHAGQLSRSRAGGAPMFSAR
jgi:hypothetical protein